MADIVTSRIFQDGEKNITAVKMNDIIGSSVIQPAFVSSKPTASTIANTDSMLILQTAGTYAQAPFSTVISSVNAGLNTDTEIWNVRLRSFNAVGNPTFEVDQRNAGNTITAVASGTLVQDRWGIAKAGTNAVSSGQNSVAAGINLPGTSFAISRNFFRVTLTTAQASLAAADYLVIGQTLEGPRWRELQNDVHSLQVLVRSSVSNLIVGASLQDPSATHSLTKTLALGAANTWTLLPLANLPLWTASGTFVNTPGNPGYTLSICLASGTTLMSPANGTWQNGNFLGAAGQSNFAASPVNSTFDLAFVQHEPGALCSTPMDLAFRQNYDDCLRYYGKTYDYGIRAGTVTNNGMLFCSISAANSLNSGNSFLKPMSKIPAMTLYSAATGAANTVMDYGGTDRVLSGSPSGTTTKSPFYLFTTTTTPATGTWVHYTADTGW